MMKKIVFTNIQWDAPKKYQKKLPKNVTMVVNPEECGIDEDEELMSWATDKLSDNFEWLIDDVEHNEISEVEGTVEWYEIVKVEK